MRQAPLLVGLVLLVFFPCLGGEFTWDDHGHIRDNALLYDLAGLRTIWLTFDNIDYWPVVYTVFWLVNALFGMEPEAFRALNVFTHCASTVVVWRILRELDLRWPLLAAALFAVHPLTLHAVGSAFQLKTTLSGLFYFASILCFLRFRREDGERRYSASLGLHILSQLTKTQSIILPVVILILCWWRERELSRDTLLRLAPFFVVSLAFGLLTIWIQGRAMAPQPIMEEGIVTRVTALGWVLGFYVVQLIAPHRQAALYPAWEIDASLVSHWIPTVLLVLSAGALVLWANRRRGGRDALMGALVFLVCLAPVSGVVSFMFLDVSRVSDHFAYMGLFAPIAVAVHHAAKSGRGHLRRSRTAAALCCVVLVLFAVRTGTRAFVYRTDVGIWREAIERYPENWMSHYHWAAMLIDQGRPDDALEHLDRAEALRGADAEIQLNRGNAWWLKGDLTKAGRSLERSIALAPWLAPAYRSLAEVRVEQSRLDEAERALRGLLALDGSGIQTRQNLGAVLLMRGQAAGAAAEFERILAVQPGFEPARRGLQVAQRAPHR